MALPLLSIRPGLVRRLGAIVMLAGGLAAPPALRADVVVLNASSDADLSDTTGGGTFTVIDRLDLATHGLYVTQFDNGPAPNFEDRAAILFSLASLPTNATITSLTLTFRETAFANAVGIVAVNGYASGGTIGLADATASANSLGSYDAIALSTGTHTVTLGTSFLQSLLGHSGFLGLRLQGTQYSVNTSLGSIEQSTSFTPPSLTVTFTPAVAPEPSSVALLGLGLPAALAWRRRSRRQRGG
jgi:hypothetical protein